MIQSTEIEPILASFVGAHFKKLSDAKKTDTQKYEIEDICYKWWMTMKGLEMALTMSTDDDNPALLSHANLAHSNTMQQIATMIHDEIGINPILTKIEKWRINLNR